MGVGDEKPQEIVCVDVQSADEILQRRRDVQIDQHDIVSRVSGVEDGKRCPYQPLQNRSRRRCSGRRVAVARRRRKYNNNY